MFSGSGHSVNSSSDSKMGEEAVITGHNLGKRALIAHATNEGIVGVVKYLVRQSIWINTSQTRHSVAMPMNGTVWIDAQGEGLYLCQCVPLKIWHISLENLALRMVVNGPQYPNVRL